MQRFSSSSSCCRTLKRFGHLDLYACLVHETDMLGFSLGHGEGSYFFAHQLDLM